ncbi:hypothetical protein JTE90_011445 [Oedothorax gibbosus]|uniref:Uncharacterized protein n=1 Tax=Oedothorax gibbosus TaxID=931172 RepID=A0AAV6VB36_9ARAC|nr:hypothetical protein JTE90_011445 [Oedothorax gibbosus]
MESRLAERAPVPYLSDKRDSNVRALASGYVLHHLEEVLHQPGIEPEHPHQRHLRVLTRGEVPQSCPCFHPPQNKQGEAHFLAVHSLVKVHTPNIFLLSAYTTLSRSNGVPVLSRIRELSSEAHVWFCLWEKCRSLAPDFIFSRTSNVKLLF